MNILSGKAKEDFEYFYEEFNVWKSKDQNITVGRVHFWSLPFEMQSGVLVKFFDEKGIFIEIESFWAFDYWMFEIGEKDSDDRDALASGSDHLSRNEALKKALRAANEHYNGNK